MNIYVSHRSALEFWCSAKMSAHLLALHNQSRKSPSWRENAPLPATDRIAASDAKKFFERNLGEIERPLHILVPHESNRGRIMHAVCHVSSRSFPRGSFIRVEPGIFVSSPELCFIQLAPKLSMPALIRLGFELCGTYGITTIGRVNYAQTIPLTTTANLRRIVESIDSMPGLAKAKKALPYIVNNSASPMETALTMLLCLPLRMGGYNLPYPHMNHQVEPNKHSHFSADKRCYYCDLLWPKASVALEYDSFQFHNNASKIADDAGRRTQLLGRGIVVISVTSRSVRNIIELDRITHILAKKLGYRLRSGEATWRTKQYQLHGLLLDF